MGSDENVTGLSLKWAYKGLSAIRSFSVWDHLISMWSVGAVPLSLSNILWNFFLVIFSPWSLWQVQHCTTESHDATRWDKGAELGGWIRSCMSIRLGTFQHRRCWVWNKEKITTLKRCGICCCFCIAKGSHLSLLVVVCLASFLFFFFCQPEMLVLILQMEVRHEGGVVSLKVPGLQMWQHGLCHLMELRVFC